MVNFDGFMEDRLNGGYGHELDRQLEDGWNGWEDFDDLELDTDGEEFDGQPDEYTEWQDFYDGDDWDHGQYDEIL
jgi:hypothetical protein